MYKMAEVIKEYRVQAFGYEVVIPKGTIVFNSTALGPDDDYRFPMDCLKIAKLSAGDIYKGLLHDLTHYGINVPAEFCGPWSASIPNQTT